MAHMRMGMIIDWVSDDTDPAEVERQFRASEFNILDLLMVADKVEVTVVKVEE